MAHSPSQQVSVIIPVFNGGDKFRKCLESLARCSPLPLETIVVADSESDGSWRLAHENGHRTLLLEQQGGPAQARNAGAQLAQGEILLFLDADVLVKPDIIEQVLDFFARNRAYSAVIGSYDDTPSENDLVSQYKNLLHHFTHQHACEQALTFWGACGAIRKSAFQSVGGFDRRYKTASIEDIELGYRLTERGFLIRLKKDLQVTHQKKWDLFTLLHTDIRQRAIPWSMLLLKNSALPNDLNLSFSARISAVAALLLAFSPLLLLLSRWALLLAIACSGLLLVANRHFYFFLLRKKDVLFCIKTLPLHWLYFIYSGLSYGAAFLGTKVLCRVAPRHFLSRFSR